MKTNFLKKVLGVILAFGMIFSIPTVTFAEESSEESYFESNYEEESTEKESYDLSYLNVGSFKSFMDYRTITSTNSVQYKLQENAYTGDYGIRMIDGRYMVAVASTFGEAGDEIEIVLEDGTVLNCVIGDIKAYTDLLGGDSSLVEFIVDRDYTPEEVELMGTYGVIFPGNVIEVIY